MLTVIDKAKMFREIVNEMADLYEKKNANYGDSFGQLFDALGPVSGLVPLHNKLDRATSLIKGNKNNFESLEDTFKDLACYSIMNLIEMKARQEGPVSTELDLNTCPFTSGSISTYENECYLIGRSDWPVLTNGYKYTINSGTELANGWFKDSNGNYTGSGFMQGVPVYDCVLRSEIHEPMYFEQFNTPFVTDVDAVDYIIRAAELGEENDEK